MFNKNIKISWRNLVRNKAYAGINIAGLALSMACGILIFTLVTFNLSFDNFHANANRIYRIVTEQHRDNITYVASVPPALGKALRTDYTYAEEVARIVNFNDEIISIHTGTDIKAFKEGRGVNFAEASYFNIFNFPLLQGDKNTALSQPNTAIITQHAAEKYFGTQNAVNKIFYLGKGIAIKVTGILKNLPFNTDQKGEIFVSYATLKQSNEFFTNDKAWGGMSSSLQCFARLRPGISPATVEGKLDLYVKKYRPNSRNVHFYKLQPLSEVHFDARYDGIMEKRTLWILSFIGIFIILTACVNFINLATAQALRRSKEVGVRKVLGSRQIQLFWQFIAETAIIVLAGIAIALLISSTLLPFVNDLFHSNMSVNPLSNLTLLLFLVLLAIVVTLLAGAYPGLILARFKPVAALKGKISQQNIGGINTRRGLIILQFAISQVLITGMIVIAVQMRYTKSTELGFDKDAVVMVPMGLDSTGVTVPVFKNKVAAIPGVQKATACYAAPSSEGAWGTSARYDNHTEDEPFNISVKAGDDQYLSTFGLELAAGRNIYPSDTVREFLVNETFVKKLNLTSAKDVLGKKLVINGGYTMAPIVGVVKDFHDGSFHSDINPVCITSMSDEYQVFAVKINMKNARQVLPGIEKTWNSIYPNQVYNYKFLDDQIADFYENENTMLILVQAFAAIAILIGCMGLYGLVMFMAAQKTKEVGIRKVLGSTITQILWLFSKEFARLIVIAFVIAAPAAWWLMNNWLQDFKFHITISPLFFVVTIVLMFIIAFVTVSYQAIKAALANPVKSLRTE